MSKGLKVILVFSVFFATLAGGCQTNKSTTMNLSTIKDLDLKRYMGTWYEIARYDHSFERGLTAVTATYELLPNGRITVWNQGYKDSPDGKLKKAKGKAKQPDPSDPGKLKVAFFLFFYADYYILELDDNYQWALVGSSSDNYLWILSRTSVLEKETMDHILSQARARGYDTDKLIMVEHPE
jgi:apolipoprotein D and lipocalin family protein